MGATHLSIQPIFPTLHLSLLAMWILIEWQNSHCPSQPLQMSTYHLRILWHPNNQASEIPTHGSGTEKSWGCASHAAIVILSFVQLDLYTRRYVLNNPHNLWSVLVSKQTIENIDNTHFDLKSQSPVCQGKDVDDGDEVHKFAPYWMVPTCWSAPWRVGAQDDLKFELSVELHILSSS